MKLGWRLLFAPVFAVAVLWVAVTGDLAGWLPTGFWHGRTQDEAGLHSIIALATAGLAFILFAGPGKGKTMRDDDLQGIWRPHCGGCERRRQVIIGYVQKAQKPQDDDGFWNGVIIAVCGFLLLGVLLQL